MLDAGGPQLSRNRWAQEQKEKVAIIMGKLSCDWSEKLAKIGWRPNDIDLIANTYLGSRNYETIIGVIKTGNDTGNLIGASTSSVIGTNRIERVLLGFSIGGDNSIRNKTIIKPEERIPGCLFIASDKFIICGHEIKEYTYSDIIVAVGSSRTITAASYDLQKMGIKNYSYSGDIYVIKFEINRQKNLDHGYDDLIFAFVINGNNNNRYDVRTIPQLWDQLGRIIISGEE